MPVVEVMLPAVRRAVAATRTGRIGVIGTRATIASGAYQDTFGAARDVEVTAVACPRFVDFVERGMTSGRQILGSPRATWSRCSGPGSTRVVLGCTHYPLLAGVLQIVLGPDVTLVSSADETAKDLVRVLMDPRPRSATPRAPPPAPHEFLATGDPEPFRTAGPPLPGAGDRRGRRAGRAGELTRTAPAVLADPLGTAQGLWGLRRACSVCEAARPWRRGAWRGRGSDAR